MLRRVDATLCSARVARASPIVVRWKSLTGGADERLV